MDFVAVITKIKQAIKRLQRKESFPPYDLNDYLFLSLGENCLTDNILERHGLKSFSTPYSHGRSNIDYAIALEQSNYCNLLEKSTLYYPDKEGFPKLCVRSNTITECDDIFEPLQMNGFEFTHHDVIGNEDHRNNYARKIERMQSIKSNKICFFYHHRCNPKKNLDALFSKVNQFLQCYEHATVIVFTQQLVSGHEKRKMIKKRINDNLYFFEFSTMAIWGGNDGDLFWARVDDDLIKKMIHETIKILAKKAKRFGR